MGESFQGPKIRNTTIRPGAPPSVYRNAVPAGSNHRDVSALSPRAGGPARPTAPSIGHSMRGPFEGERIAPQAAGSNIDLAGLPREQRASEPLAEWSSSSLQGRSHAVCLLFAAAGEHRESAAGRIAGETA